MKCLAVALDFDGTIAVNDQLDPGVREAIGSLRSANIVVLIVTGRILSELERVAGNLHFVDAVVAENGAVIHFPDSGYTKRLGDAPPDSLIQAARLEGVSIQVGSSVVETDAHEAARVLAILQRLELPLALSFNRGRLMVLPQSVSKATGLREIFKGLRLSLHNAIAIGDGENDHELLRSCEFGIAVSWGSATLKMVSDYVIDGTGPEAVGAYLKNLAVSKQIPDPVKVRRNLLLGYTPSGNPFSLTIRGQRMLIAGDTKSGKSWAAGLICEQLILLGYALLIIDPEGDYTSLEALPGVVVYGGADPLPKPRDLLRALRHADISVVVDLSHTSMDQRYEYIQNLLVSLKTLREVTGLPHYIVLDEAHYFFPRSVPSSEIEDMHLDSSLLITYRVSLLHPALLQKVDAVMLTRESEPRECQALQQLCETCKADIGEEQWSNTVGMLALGEAVALPINPEGGGRITKFHLVPRLTPHVRHVAKYVDIPVPVSDQFVFWKNGSPSGRSARTLGQLVEIMEEEPIEHLNHHLLRHDFSKWIAGIFGDYPLAHSVEIIEHEYQSGNRSNVTGHLVEAIRTRYQFTDPLR